MPCLAGRQNVNYVNQAKWTFWINRAMGGSCNYDRRKPSKSSGRACRKRPQNNQQLCRGYCLIIVAWKIRVRYSVTWLSENLRWLGTENCHTITSDFLHITCNRRRSQTVEYHRCHSTPTHRIHPIRLPMTSPDSRTSKETFESTHFKWDENIKKAAKFEITKRLIYIFEWRYEEKPVTLWEISVNSDYIEKLRC